MMQPELQVNEYIEFFEAQTRYGELFWKYVQQTTAALNKRTLNKHGFDLHPAELGVCALGQGYFRVLRKERGRSQPRQSFPNQCGLDAPQPLVSRFGVGPLGGDRFAQKAHTEGVGSVLPQQVAAYVKQDADFIGAEPRSDWYLDGYDPTFRTVSVKAEQGDERVMCAGRQVNEGERGPFHSLWLPLDLAIGATGSLLAHAALTARKTMREAKRTPYSGLPRPTRFFWMMLFYDSGYEVASRHVTDSTNPAQLRSSRGSSQHLQRALHFKTALQTVGNRMGLQL